MRKLITIFVLVSALVMPLPATYAQRRSGKATSAALAPAHHGAEQITAAQLRDYLYFIASDEMEGRDTPSRGLDTTAKFIALNLSRWGLKPAGDNGTYFQRIALHREKVDVAQTHAEINGQKFNPGDDFVFSPTAGNASGPLVYAGNGWFIKSKKIDPYQGMDVKDKIVVISGGGGLPKGVGFNDLRGKQGEDWADPLTYARKRGAKGLVTIADSQSLANWDRIRRRIAGRGAISVDKFQEQNGPQIPSILITPKMAAALFQGEKQSADTVSTRAATGEWLAPFEFSADKKMSFTVAATPEPMWTQNVVAIFEGSDPALKNEYVALGAHYDHVGIGMPVNGDAIYNGADDDGSGTTALLAMAETLAHTHPRPRRSILFVWHAGEEKGLWGSRYFTQFPTVPLERIVTQVNIDMIGRSHKAGDTNPKNKELSGPNEIYVIGSKMMSTELGRLSEAVNKSYLKLAYNYRYDDPNDPNRFFFRSDHYNYAQKGIPIIFFFDGVHEDYHEPSDSPDKIDYEKMEKVTRTIYMTVWALADRAMRPRVDKKLPTELSGN